VATRGIMHEIWTQNTVIEAVNKSKNHRLSQALG